MYNECHIDFKNRNINLYHHTDNLPNRRTFLKYSGFGILSLASLGFTRSVLAKSDQTGISPDHYVPVEKNLSPEWIQSLFTRGKSQWYSGKDLDRIAMPVGGICAGQVYLTGEGKLAEWEIFNHRNFTGYGRESYDIDRFPKFPVHQGVALYIDDGEEQFTTSIDKKGFEDIKFCGQYPIGYIAYNDKKLPVSVKLKAFSPFIPLNTDDSSLPATVLNYTIKNTSRKELDITIAGWLENKVNMHSANDLSGQRYNEVEYGNGTTSVICRAKQVKETSQPRKSIIFEDFEGSDYGKWKVKGQAFGKAPADGTLQNQQAVSGFLGKRLVNTYLGGDDKLQGKLISPEFTIERKFINFLIGGGSHDNTCLNVIVNNNTVRTAKGRNSEKLAWHSLNVSQFMGKKAHIEIVDAESGGWGHINIDQIEFADNSKSGFTGTVEQQEDYGTMALSVLGDDGVVTSRSLPEGEIIDKLFYDEMLLETKRTTRDFTDTLIGAAGKKVTLKPGRSQDVTFIVSWHFPNRKYNGTQVGNFYDNRFNNAAEVARYISVNISRLAGDTELWHDTWYDSSLPIWFLDRIHSTLSTLATGTCQWWKNGRFWAWEGVGCCHGTCTHVWNYAHGMARVFPELERSARQMQDFAEGKGFVPETGMIRFRGEGWNAWAADGQAGSILKAYREHQTSADSKFLSFNWKNIKKALEFLIVQDGDDDGLIEGKQHNTFDIDFYGPNPMIVSLYLAALLAGQQMAIEMNDRPFAERCRNIFEAGRKNAMSKLFNGEYFIQIVDHTKHPDAQYGDGCLSDQLFGQGWAHQLGLGSIFPRPYNESTLQSIWKYNWAPDVGPHNEHHPPERWFAHPGQAGLFTCTWPKSRHMGKKSVRYRNEIWTGIEYQVAGHMAWEGMVRQALAICKGIHDRYHPGKHNPFNEVECGDHYSRGLASWSVFIGLCGFEYHGPAGRIGFSPRISSDDFKAAFTAARAWGNITQKRTGREQTNSIHVKYGQLQLNQIALSVPRHKEINKITAMINDEPISIKIKQDGAKVLISFDTLSLEKDQVLCVTL